MKVLKYKQLNEKLGIADIAKSLDMNTSDFEDSNDLMDLANKLMEDEEEYDDAVLDAEIAIEDYVDSDNDISFIYNKSLFNDDKEEYTANFAKLNRDILKFAKENEYDTNNQFKYALHYVLGKYIKKNAK